MASYVTMQLRILGELQRSELNTAVSPLTVSPIKSAILDAVNHYQRFRFWFNETSATQSTVSGTATYNWPATMVQLDSLVITVSGRLYTLQQVAPRDIDEMYTVASTGQPTVFASYAQQFRLYPTPNAVYVLTQYFLKTFTALSGDSDTNVWTTEAEELIRTRAKKTLAAQYLQDMNMVGVLDAYEQNVLAGLQRQTTASTSSGRLRAW